MVLFVLNRLADWRLDSLRKNLLSENEPKYNSSKIKFGILIVLLIIMISLFVVSQTVYKASWLITVSIIGVLY